MLALLGAQHGIAELNLKTTIASLARMGIDVALPRRTFFLSSFVNFIGSVRRPQVIVENRMSAKPSSRYDSIGTTSTGLIDQIRLRDKEAWERLVQLYGRLVHHWTQSSGLGDDDRADVFQEVFRAVDRHIGNYNHHLKGSSFRAWLRTITKSKVIDAFRRKQREPDGRGGAESDEILLHAPDENSFDVEEDAGSERAMLMSQALKLVRNDFESKTWLAFWRTAADGIPTSVVADELEMTQAAIRKAKSRVLRRLRDVFAGLEDFDDVMAGEPKDWSSKDSSKSKPSHPEASEDSSNHD